jgi:putative FmdB family regulatory protein
MPNYAFKCESCDHSFELFLKMAENDVPTKKPCPNCNKKKVTKDWGEQRNSVAYDTTLTPTKVCGSAWNEVMDKVKRAAPRSQQDRIEQSRTFNAGRFERH